MTVMVIGLGSMGKRRIRIIKKLFPQYDIIGVDGREDRREECCRLYNISCYKDIETAINIQPLDCAFVCTSPLSHATIIKSCLQAKLHVFSEINLVADGYEDNILLAQRNQKTLFLSSTPMYKSEMQYISQAVAHKEPFYYIYHVGQYLPDWHPWENINDFFVSDKRTNGCRELMAIELPWMLHTFGEVENFHVIADNLTKLEIAYKDSYQMQFLHKNGNRGLVAFDVTSRTPVRHLELYNEELHIEWFGKPDDLCVRNIIAGEDKFPCRRTEYEQREGYSAMINETPYEQEVANFFACIESREDAKHSFEADAKILNLIDRIEEIAETN